MNEELHRTDDIFKSAYQRFEEAPSHGSWEKINAALDKSAAETLKRKSAGWKRTTFVLLLILAVLKLYESGIISNSQEARRKNHDIIAADKNGSIQKIENSQRQVDNRIPDNIISKNTKQDGLRSNIDINPDFEEKNGFESVLPDNVEDKQEGEITNEKNNLHGTKKSINSLVPGFTEETNEPLPLKSLRNETIVTFPVIKIKRAEITPLLKGIRLTLLSPAINQPLENGFSKNKTQKPTSRSSTRSIITGFTAYDWMRYRLDNDLPATSGIRQREAQEPSYSAGVLVSHPIYRRWDLQSGVIFSFTAIGIAPQKVYAEMESGGTTAYKYIISSGYAFITPDFNSSPAVGDSLLTEEAKHRVQYISVPLMMRYTVAGGKFSLSPGAGIAANFTTAAKLETEIEDAFNRETVTVTELKGAKKFHWSIVADATLQFELNKKLSLQFRPSFRYAVSPISKNNDLETFPYSFSAGAGVSYKF